MSEIVKYTSENQAIREINKVTLAANNCKGINADGTMSVRNREFEAYLSSAISLNMSSEMLSLNADQANLMTTLGANVIFGKVPAFDYPRWFGYRGTAPLSIPISCYLKLGSDAKLAGREAYIKDILTPLTDLFSMALPYRDSATLAQQMSKHKLGDSLDTITNWLTGRNLSQYTDQIYFLNVPSPMSHVNQESSEETNTRITLAVGKFNTIKFREVIIKSITVTIPTLILDMGYPERVDITINVETLRNATQDSLKDIFIV